MRQALLQADPREGLRSGAGGAAKNARGTNGLLLRTHQFWCRGFFQAGAPIHPLIQPRLAEPPAVSQPEGRDKSRRGVTIEAIRADPEIVRGLTNVHDFANLGLGERGFHGFLQSSKARPVYHSPNGERNPVFEGYWIVNPISPNFLQYSEMRPAH